MNLTPEQQELGRRNFLRALAGTPALAALGRGGRRQGPGARRPRARRLRRPRRRRPRAPRSTPTPPTARCVALCDINPAHLAEGRRVAGQGRSAEARRTTPTGRRCSQKEDLEAVIARAAALAARRHHGRLPGGGPARAVREDDGLGRRRLPAHARRARRRAASCSRSATSASTTRSTRRPTTASSRPGSLGDVYHARLVWHRNGNWRRKDEPALARLRPVALGLPDLRPPDQLAALQEVLAGPHGRAREPPGHDRRLVLRRGRRRRSLGSGGVYRFKDGREVPDHVYAHARVPGAAAPPSSPRSSRTPSTTTTRPTTARRARSSCAARPRPTSSTRAAAGKATPSRSAAKAPGPAARRLGEPVRATPPGAARGAARAGGVDRCASYRYEISGFCAAVRTGRPLRAGPTAMGSARACIAGFEAIQKKTRIVASA